MEPKKYIALILVFLGVGIAALPARSTGQELALKAIRPASSENLVTLESRLEQLEANFKVHFLYKSSTVKHKFINAQKALTGDLEEQLGQLLEPQKLTFNKLNARSYTIVPAFPSAVNEMQAAARDTLRGKVTDREGESLPGVNILLKGTARGASTDMDGNFKLALDDLNGSLMVSYIGFQTQEVPINGRTYVEIIMEPQVLSTGEELVVVGYGTQKRSNITGAVSSVSTDEIKETPVLRVEQALQGRTPGVYVANSSGQPGEMPTVRIRGAGTTGNSDPLYVVDGMPVGGIDYLNPGDIESIEVLKDAASAAIYGARAANGVVLITTKNGEAGKMQVTYDGYAGVQNAWKKIPMMNAREYMLMMNEGAANAGMSLPFVLNPQVGPGTDWQNEIFTDNAPMMSHQLTVSGGNNRTTYSSSLSYFSQEGIIGGSKSQFDRYTFRLNLDNKVSEKFKFGNNFNYTNIDRNAVLDNSEWGSPLSNALNMDPLTPVYETDSTRIQQMDPNAVQTDGGRYYGISDYVTQEIVNPLARLEVTHGNTNVDKLVNNLYAEYSVLENLKVKSSFGLDLAYVGNNNYNPVYYLNSSTKNDKSLVSKSDDRYFTWLWENTASYEQNFGKHDIGVLAGMTAQRTHFEGLYGSKSGLVLTDPKNAWINTATDQESMQATGGAWNSSLLSYFGRANYSYNDKYLFTGILRVDGSSKFGPNNRYAVFPSASIGWVISNEKFLKDHPVINFLKLRASWGQNGNQDIGNFAYTSTIETGAGYTYGTDETFVSGALPSRVPNPDLKWETSEQLDFGLDLGLWEDKLMLNMDYYKKETKDLLVTAPIPGHVGNNAPIVNGGNVENRGLEVGLQYRNYVSDFDYNIGVNFAYNQNEVTYIGNAEGVINGAGFATYGTVSRVEEGYPIGYFWGYKTDGIFQNQQQIDNYVDSNGDPVQPSAVPGDVKFLDLDGNGRIDDGDRTIIGNPTPDWTFGINLGGQYKGFDLSIFMQGSLGNDIFNATRRNDLNTSNMPKDYLNRWTGEGSSNSMPRFTWNDANQNWTRISDLYVEDGSYLRVKTMQVGYTLPARLLTSLALQNARIYVSADNLLTFTGYSGFDPEIGAQSALDIGIDRGIYPQSRSFRLGLKVTF